MLSLSKKWKIILSSCIVSICVSGFSEAMQQDPLTEVLEATDGKKVEVPSLFALLDPNQPCGLNLALIEKRETILHDSEYFYNSTTREDLTVDIRNLRKLKRSPLYTEWQEKLSDLVRTKTYISTQVPLIIQNKLATIQNINATLTQKETALKELEEHCQKSLKHIEKIKAIALFDESIKATEDKILQILGDNRFGNNALTKAHLDQLPPL